MCWYINLLYFPVMLVVCDFNLISQGGVISLFPLFVSGYARFFSFPLCYRFTIFLPHLHGMAYIKFLVMFSTIHILFSLRYHRFEKRNTVSSSRVSNHWLMYLNKPANEHLFYFHSIRFGNLHSSRRIRLELAVYSV